MMKVYVKSWWFASKNPWIGNASVKVMRINAANGPQGNFQKRVHPPQPVARRRLNAAWQDRAARVIMRKSISLAGEGIMHGIRYTNKGHAG
jgi:hypothetical protein